MNIFIGIVCVLYFIYNAWDMNIEKNEETGEYLLFYSDIFSNFERKYIKLW